MGRVEGKVALISGAARGQGRSHALRLAEEGADVVLLDACAPIASAPIDMPSSAELERTADEVRGLGRRALAHVVDVRDSGGLAKVVDDAVAAFGGIDVVCANAGIFPTAPALETDDAMWEETLAINLTGVFRTVRAALRPMVDAGRGGSVIVTSSTAGLKGVPNTVAYSASKHGVVGVVRVLANEMARHHIRVNSVHPTGVDTAMIRNEATYRLMVPGEEHPTSAQAEPVFASINALPVPWVEASDVSAAVLWLASDESRFVTGIALPVDAGATQK
ncbi:mycofactocin-coupled SDR family oxidoreductase [Actinomycetospora termitidis]|uniref:Mycofactocin-coupled SDR family oxidoreductase n=1 Tax=Actinomycetospora termitidis TaxID=3053470 RepID=A0ABT7M9P7_9PSEU|nr:mycofactocin-coupled SDR family oxidoreductase [Actinomycetospora sp. Odt1-22]MDL5157395.1 mycofactocin-coupled SDR family oxidoreductase [Actinomycetospora sp. Odt1-22]